MDLSAAEWVYSKALLTFRKEGDSVQATVALQNALRHNPFVPAYLLGKKIIPRILPNSITVGGEDEAFSCAAEFMEAWRKVPGALNWIEKQALALVSPEAPQIGRNDPCFCGSGKKFKKCCLPKMTTHSHIPS